MEADNGQTEQLGNDEIYKMMQKSLEEIEKKLENYNFRGDSVQEGSDKGNSEYPIFTTVLDFYQKAQFTLGRQSFFMSDPKFELDNHSTIK